MLSKKFLGCEDIKDKKTKLGLVNNESTWRDFFLAIFSSDVFTWGKSATRTGHYNCTEGEFETPKILNFFRRKCINFVGKTAEVGSIVKSHDGQKIYLWGYLARFLGTNMISTVNVKDLSSDPGDTVVDCSCGHDSGFIVVLKSGKVFHLNDDVWLEVTRYLKKHFIEGEKPVVSIGSQSSIAGIVTNYSRTWLWDSGELRMVNSDKDVPDTFFRLTEPVDCKTNELFQIVKVRFGHSNFYAIDSEGRLYIHVNHFGWEQMEGTEHLNVIDVDCGSAHSGLVTDTGEAYTWGSNGHGNLGHFDLHDRYKPTRVEWLMSHGHKIVAIGCGGYLHWSGGFTLFLTNDNKLFCCGILGNVNSTTPVQIGEEEFSGRQILSISAGEDWAAVVASGSLKHQKSCTEQQKSDVEE
eukprot:TRINITY_DN2896_c0_g2_i14.p1 TRINITY_DN2896_c0_g2~~TRINITY_DN2896_c0_g2_i14.p1  ORF type:complete len:409 (+),score=75.48 TRINITY_DN2896_c0_g2_i14:251-1477(+)